MKIAIVGTGYVGLVSGTCFAEMGVDVTCVDVNAEKIEALERGEVPIYEPGLDEMVLRNQREGRLHFTTDLTTCLNDVDVVFSAVGTPPDEDGSADLKYVLEVARTVGQHRPHDLRNRRRLCLPVLYYPLARPLRRARKHVVEQDAMATQWLLRKALINLTIS